MIKADNPYDWWEKAREIITRPVEWEQDNEGSDYCPIQEVIERINEVFGPFWDVKVNDREYEERTSEAIIDATVVFHTPKGMPDITKDVIGRDDAVRPKYKNGEKVEKYEDRPIKSIGDVYAGARSNAIKRAAKDLEIALRMNFANPALNDKKSKSSNERKGGNICDDCGDEVPDKVVKYCNDYSDRFNGKIVCFKCQQNY